VQFIFATDDGRLWHTIRFADGSWQPLGDVAGQISVPGPVRTVAAAGVNNGDVQFIFATDDGRLWHTIRFADGSWQPLGDVAGQISVPGPARSVAAAGMNDGSVHFMIATDAPGTSAPTSAVMSSSAPVTTPSSEPSPDGTSPHEDFDVDIQIRIRSPRR
jgi:hypothetical protein